MKIEGRKRIVLVGLTGIWLMMSGACATLVIGSYQDIGINSNPPGASVFINGTFCGKTPLVAKLAREIDYGVVLKLKGYRSAYVGLSRRPSGWTFFNILWANPGGAVSDLQSGAAYTLTPSDIDVKMVRSGGPPGQGDHQKQPPVRSGEPPGKGNHQKQPPKGK